jgi:hypothetical protein
MAVAPEPGVVRLVLALVALGASPDPDVDRLRSAVEVPLPVEMLERSGEDTLGADPTVTVACGTLAVAVVPVVVAVTVGAATVVVVPLVDAEPPDVVTVAVVGVTSTVPVLETVTDVLVSPTVIGPSSGPGSASARTGHDADSAAVRSATAKGRFIPSISSLLPTCCTWWWPDRLRHFAGSNARVGAGSVTIR